jgi:hypothetical protein
MPILSVMMSVDDKNICASLVCFNWRNTVKFFYYRYCNTLSCAIRSKPICIHEKPINILNSTVVDIAFNRPPSIQPMPSLCITGHLGSGVGLVRLWFGYGSAMVRLWFSYGSAMVRLWFSYGSAMVRLWFGYGSAMVRLWFSFSSAMVRL